MEQSKVNSNSNIRYNDYAVIIAYLTGKRELQTGCRKESNLLDEPLESLKKEFKKYKSNLEQHWTTTQSNNGSLTFAKYLFSPVCFKSLGITDSVAITLVDDLDPLISIPAHIGSPIDQMTLAFCPRLDSIGFESEVDSPFTEWHHLLDKDFSTIDSYRNSDSRIEEYRFQNEYPLAVITRFKISGLSLLGFGLAGQRTILQTMAQKIQTVLSELKSRTDSLSENGLDIVSEDVDFFKCIFMDSQGPEEITAFIACRNYTVATTVIAAVRNLTRGDILANSKELERMMKRDRFHQEMLPSIFARKKPDLNDNHIFHSTYSTLCFSRGVFGSDKRFITCKGSVEAYMHLNIKPGHLNNIQDQYEAAFADANHEQVRGKIPEQERSDQDVRIRRFALGSYDLMLPFPPIQKFSYLNVISTSDLFQKLYTLLSQQGTSEDSNSSLGADLLDTSTLLVIPYPELNPSTAKVPGPSHAAIAPCLEDLNKKLFNDGEQDGNAVPTVNLNFENLVVTMRKLGVPWSLRRTISYLYQNFAHCLADTYRYTQVIDLFDVFEDFHSLLIKLSSRSDKRQDEGNKWQSTRIFGEQDIDELSTFVAVLGNALTHRSQAQIETKEIRDMAIDFRGGLNQLISATNVPLEAAVCILRLTLENKKLDEENVTRENSQLCKATAITRITFHPKTTCRRLHLSQAQGYSTFLAQVDMNVVHLLAPAETIHYFHQAAMLVWGTLAENKNWGESQSAVIPIAGSSEGITPYTGSIVQSDRHAEVFAGLLQQMLIFGTNTDLFLKQYIARYSMHAKSVSHTPEDAITKFSEILIRAFLIIDPVKTLGIKETFPEEFPTAHDVYIHEKGVEATEIDEALDRFREMVNSIGPFYSRFNELWGDTSNRAAHDYCESRFKDIYQHSFKAVSPMWTCTSEIHNSIHSHPGCKTRGDYSCDTNALVRDSLVHGQPITIVALDALKDHGNSGSYSSDELHFQSLALVSRIVYWQTHFLFDNLDLAKQLHLNRNAKTGDVYFSENGGGDKKTWNSFQIDSAQGQLFCINPAVRRKRLLQQITAIKTFWDISTKLRAETFTDVVTKFYQ